MQEHLRKLKSWHKMLNILHESHLRWLELFSNVYSFYYSFFVRIDSMMTSWLKRGNKKSRDRDPEVKSCRKLFIDQKDIRLHLSKKREEGNEDKRVEIGQWSTSLHHCNLRQSTLHRQLPYWMLFERTSTKVMRKSMMLMAKKRNRK